MSLDLLKQIAATPLPASFHSPRDVDAIKILRKAGLVIALVDAPPELGAKVLAITAEGRDELLRLHYPESPQSPNGRIQVLPRVAQRMREVLRRSVGAG